MASEDPDLEVDFLRFFGRRNADAEGEEKDANVLVGPGSLGLRSDVSVLAISNRFGALIAGTAGGFKWAWLKELRACCVPGGEAGAAAAFHGVACGGQPLCLRLNSDETLLAVLLVSEGVHTLLVYDMVDLYHRAGAGDAAPLLSHRFVHATAGTEIQTSPTAPGQAAAVGAGAAVLLSVRTGEGSVSETKLPLPAGSVARSVGWSSDGACIYVGCGDGSVVRSSISAAVAEPFVVVLAPPADLPGHEVTLISPISDRFLLLGFDLPDEQRKEDAFTEPEVRVLDLHDGTGTGGAGALHRCAAGLFPGGREPGPADGELARRRLYCAVLPEWRLAVVCSSDSDAVSCIGSRKAGEGQRWQKWTLPDEEGPPSVPTFERGDVFEDQYVVGMGFDVGNEEQIVVVAGEEKFAPSPVLWAATSHGGIVAWTALHKKAPVDEQTKRYAFMRHPEHLPVSEATGAAQHRTPPAAAAVPAPAPPAPPPPAAAFGAVTPSPFGSFGFGAPGAKSGATADVHRIPAPAFGAPAAACGVPAAIGAASGSPACGASAFGAPSPACSASASALSATMKETAIGAPPAPPGPSATGPASAAPPGARPPATETAAAGRRPAAPLGPTAAQSTAAAPSSTTAPRPATGGTADEDLLSASEMGDHEALLKAIREGGDVDKPDGTSTRPLHWAAKCGRPDDLRALLAAGAAVDAVNKAGVTALIYAASTGQDDCVPVLLKAGASTGIRTDRGRTALDAAREKLGKASADDRPRFEAVVRQLEAAAPTRPAAPPVAPCAPAPAPAAAASSAAWAAPAAPVPAAAPAASRPSAKAPAPAAQAAPAAPPAGAASMFGASMFGALGAALPEEPASAVGPPAVSATKPTPRAGAVAQDRPGARERSGVYFGAPDAPAAAADPFHGGSTAVAGWPAGGGGAAAGGGKRASGDSGAPGAARAATSRPFQLSSPLRQLQADMQAYAGAAHAELRSPFLRTFEQMGAQLARLEEAAHRVDAILATLPPPGAAPGSAAAGRKQGDGGRTGGAEGREPAGQARRGADSRLSEMQSAAAAMLRSVESRFGGVLARAERLDAQVGSVLAPMVRLLGADEPDPWTLERLCLLPLLPDEMSSLERTATEIECALRRARVDVDVAWGGGATGRLRATLAEQAAVLAQVQKRVAELSLRAGALEGGPMGSHLDSRRGTYPPSSLASPLASQRTERSMGQRSGGRLHGALHNAGRPSHSPSLHTPASRSSQQEPGLQLHAHPEPLAILLRALSQRDRRARIPPPAPAPAPPAAAPASRGQLATPPAIPGSAAPSPAQPATSTKRGAPPSSSSGTQPRGPSQTLAAPSTQSLFGARPTGAATPASFGATSPAAAPAPSCGAPVGAAACSAAAPPLAFATPQVELSRKTPHGAAAPTASPAAAPAFGFGGAPAFTAAPAAAPAFGFSAGFGTGPPSTPALSAGASNAAAVASGPASQGGAASALSLSRDGKAISTPPASLAQPAPLCAVPAPAPPPAAPSAAVSASAAPAKPAVQAKPSTSKEPGFMTVGLDEAQGVLPQEARWSVYSARPPRTAQVLFFQPSADATPAASAAGCAFGLSGAAAAPPAPQPATQPAVARGGFGAVPALAAPALAAFGAANPFGAPAGETSAFGALPLSTRTPFGAAPAAAPSLAFGAPPAAAPSIPAAGCAFGQPSPLGGGVAFGSSAAGPAFGMSSGLGMGARPFGMGRTATPAFGASPAPAFGQPSAFGATPATPGTGAFSGFASVAGSTPFAAQASAVSGFSAAATPSAAFGAAAAPATAGFGGGFAATPSTVFGTPAPASGFGAFAAAAPVLGGFGSVAQQTGGFGAPAPAFNAPAATAPRFGGHRG